MRQRASHLWSAGFLLLLLVCTATMMQAQEAPANRSMLTVDRLFGGKEFDTEPVPELHWSKQTSTYVTLVKPAMGKGRDVVRHDPATGKTDVIIPASAFLPKDAKEPLKIDGFEFSKDETKLLIYTNSKKVWRRNTRGDYWLMDVATRELKKLGGTAPEATLMFAKLSPDATRVAYVREHNLYVQDLRSLNITPLTTDGSKTLINGTSDWVNEEELSLRDCFRWSPDGSHLLFWQFDTTGVAEFHMINNVVSKSPQITTFAYPKVGDKNSATRLGVLPVAGGAVRWLELPGDQREHYLPHAEWTTDGKQLMVQQFNRLQNELRVFMADPKTGKARVILTETDSAWIENENPVRWLNENKNFLWLSERSGWRHAYQASIDGGPLTPITKGAFDLIDIEAIDQPGGWLYYYASPTNATQRYLYRVKLDGSKTEQVSPATQAGTHKYAISPNAAWAIHSWSNFTTPPVVELVKLSDHSVVRTITDNKKLRDALTPVKKPTLEFFKVDIGDGITMDGWSMKPADMQANAKLPLLMYVYGEPHGQTVRDAWGGQQGLWHWMLAQEGFIVASVDNRGTNVPRGREWRKSVHRQIGIIAPQEQAKAVRELVRRWPNVDPTRIGSWGWSGGGSMSLNAIFRYPELYRTAIAVAPMADQVLYDTIYQERYMGLPSDNAANYRDGSPIAHAHKLRGNLLLIHGTGDDNCHYQVTERLMEELIAKGKRFSVLPYPNRSHAVKEGPNTERHFWGTMHRFLRDNLQSSNAPPLDPVTQISEPPAKNPPKEMSTIDRDIRDVAGWKVHINKVLLNNQAEDTERAMKLLKQMLDEIIRVVPKNAVTELQKVPLYFNPEYPGIRPVAEYHPGAEWLRKNGRDPVMAQAVEFTNVRIFEAETKRMPNFALHELAHAFHDRVLPKGHRNEQLQAAYARMKDSGKYAKVERHFGNGKPNTFEKAYALTNPMEYFAEATEAYFTRNDFYPFTREELKKHDPEMFELLGKLWK